MLNLLAAFMLMGPRPKFVVIDSAVRERLARDWDTSNPHQLERGYCVAYVEGNRWGVPVYRVWAIERARTVRATTHTVLSECPIGEGVGFLHIHPPSTCEVSWDCHMGGPDAWQCFPSEVDQESLDISDEPFGLIQCDRNAVVPYFKTLTTKSRQ